MVIEAAQIQSRSDAVLFVSTIVVFVALIYLYNWWVTRRGPDGYRGPVNWTKAQRAEERLRRSRRRISEEAVRQRQSADRAGRVAYAISVVAGGFVLLTIRSTVDEIDWPLVASYAVLALVTAAAVSRCLLLGFGAARAQREYDERQ